MFNNTDDFLSERGIDGCTTQAFHGATVTRLADFVSNGRINLKNVNFVIVHVGTNNVSSSQSVDTILSYHGDLIHQIKSKTDAKIIFTSLLPRLVDFKLSQAKLNKVNSELRRLCSRRSLLFCNLYCSLFFKLILPFETKSANLAIVAPGNDCVVHPSIPLTYLGIETEIIVLLFSL
jgi:hypothetical protein